ncbi:hypothetical protein niasHT_014579 [Heterodera trifolii]|uniref:Uncharacterized protein n=1 Tax=Heterodera trifolii TaxID=157864 RepID=A0ABD2LHR4_9BILA
MPPPFCRQRGPSLSRTPSLHCRGPSPVVPPSGRRGPLPSTDPPHHSVIVGADPLSPLPRTLPRRSAVGAARTPPFYGPSPPFRHRRRGPPLSGGADPLSPSTRTPSLHRRGPPLFHGPTLSTVAGPSPTARTPSSYCAAGPSPPFRCPGGADPLSPAALTPSLRRRGPPLSIGADPLSPPSIDGQ